MKYFEGSATIRVPNPASAAFDVITDVDQLPAWNDAIERVTERPEQLAAGAEWVVVMHPRPLPRWTSRSRVAELDRQKLRFGYETRTDDGNPSYARWLWEVVRAGGAAEVRVHWEANPKTFGRTLLGARIRRRMLANEVPASLRALAAAVSEAAPRAEPVNPSRG